MRIPRNHIADETLARIAVAAKRTRRAPAELEPSDEELVDLPSSLMPTQAPALEQRSAPAAPAAESVPPLNESGLDMGLVLHGADSFDAMLEGGQ